MIDLGLWHWLALAGVMFVLEVFAPGAFMLWIGFAALASALVALILPNLAWQAQLALFAVFCIASIFAWRHYFRNRKVETDQPTLNQRGEQYVGRTFTLVNDIENGVGKIIVGDTHWKVSGDDLPAGRKVTVTGTDGTILLVEVAE